ncbi:hypothetical protein KUCAC02_011282 [Chaenocephalus aceratus]|uniref:Uncharacterized protein n=1 Tax=Chaenocephalus aceratus TaxID=36190 RepID=A0ACB9WWV2_CHAAC|nr:hypothetical protein KUCAC02_011282 [Chaenocephalus aceratus]
MTSSNQFYKRGLLQPLLINIPLSFQQTLATALLISATFLPNFSLSFCGGGEGRIWGGEGWFAPGDSMTKQSSLHDSVGRLPGPRSATLDQTAESLEESAAALGEIRKTSNARRVYILKLDFSIPSPSSVRKGQMGAAESQG